MKPSIYSVYFSYFNYIGTPLCAPWIVRVGLWGEQAKPQDFVNKKLMGKYEYKFGNSV